MLGGALFMTSDALLATNKFAVAAAGGEPVDPRHLLGRAVVHRVVAEARHRERGACGPRRALSSRPRARARVTCP